MVSYKDLILHNLKNNLGNKGIDTNILLSQYKQFGKYKKVMKASNEKSVSNMEMIEKTFEKNLYPKKKLTIKDINGESIEIKEKSIAPIVLLENTEDDNRIMNNTLIMSLFFTYAGYVVEKGIKKLNLIKYLPLEEAEDVAESDYTSKIVIVETQSLINKRNYSQKVTLLEHLKKYVLKRKNQENITFIIMSKDLIKEIAEEKALQEFFTDSCLIPII